MLQPGLVGEEKWPEARPQSPGLWALLSVREILVGVRKAAVVRVMGLQLGKKGEATVWKGSTMIQGTES